MPNARPIRTMASPTAGNLHYVDGVQKRRACDECRSRKLACSKQPDGCTRCKNEGIACFYSPQKPMGRPRKRRLVEDEPPPAPYSQSQVHEGVHSQHHNQPQIMPCASRNTCPDMPVDPPVDPSLSFLDESNSNSSHMNFVDMLPNNYVTTWHTEPQIYLPVDHHMDGFPNIPLQFNQCHSLAMGDTNEIFQQQQQQLQQHQHQQPIELCQHWNPMQRHLGEQYLDYRSQTTSTP